MISKTKKKKSMNRELPTSRARALTKLSNRLIIGLLEEIIKKYYDSDGHVWMNDIISLIKKVSLILPSS